MYKKSQLSPLPNDNSMQLLLFYIISILYIILPSLRSLSLSFLSPNRFKMNWSSHNIDPYLDPEGHDGNIRYPDQACIGSVDVSFLKLPTGQSVPTTVLSPYTHFPHLSLAPSEWNTMPPLPPIGSSPRATTCAIDAPTVEFNVTDEGANDIEVSNMSHSSTGPNSYRTNSSSSPMMDEPRRSMTASHKPAKGKASRGRCPAYRTQYVVHDIHPISLLKLISDTTLRSTADHTHELICEWRDCNYSGRFQCPAELMRHIQMKHVLPGSYRCSKRDCKAKFNRKDNLEAHVRRIHESR